MSSFYKCPPERLPCCCVSAEGQQGPPGPAGAQGVQGVQGPPGPAGPAGTVSVQFLSATNNADAQLVATNPVLFDATTAAFGAAITHTTAAVFAVTEAGSYQISYNVPFSTGGGIGVPASVFFVLRRNGVNIRGSFSSVTITQAGSAATLNGGLVATLAAGDQITLVYFNSDGPTINVTGPSLTIQKLTDAAV